ncbi:MAG: riboflavin synthase [Desulfovermiculus sp.]|nr:riboflavin synthase [Desulfovermiculus sp.]
MFTGLVQTLGSIQTITGSRTEQRMRIASQATWPDLQVGESIAVNGVCLSVEEFTSSSFWVYASGETLELSNLGRLKTGAKVNLERALSLQDRLGGHLVSGHIDCLARVDSMRGAGQSYIYRVVFDTQWSWYVVPKGSVALDGISLTVNDCGHGFLEVNIIPATQKETTIDTWRPGTELNMEVDLIAKYVQRMLKPWQASEQKEKPDLSMDFLRQHGFGPK